MYIKQLKKNASFVSKNIALNKILVGCTFIELLYDL